MPFRIALSGLNAASADLRVIGNNVANASTTGFKKSRAEFADVFATSNLGTSSNAIGAGVRISSVAQQFTQGNVSFTDNNLDLAVSGSGFFRMNDNGVTTFTRSGAFGVDRSGYITNAAGMRLTAFTANDSGDITGAIDDLQLNTADIPPLSTSTVVAGLNLDAAAKIPVAPVPTNGLNITGTLNSAGGTVTPPNTTIFDSFGGTHTSTVQFVNTAPNTWTANLQIDGSTVESIPNVVFTGVGGTVATVNGVPAGAPATIPFSEYTLLTPATSAGSKVTILADVSALTQPAAASSVVVAENGTGRAQSAFDVTDSLSYNNSTAVTVYDSLGTSHLATTYYRKTGTPNIWETYLFVDGTQIDGPDTLTFTSSGDLSQINGAAVPPRTLTSPVFVPIGGAAPMPLSYDLTQVSQYGSAFSVNSLSQNGYSTGRLSGIDIADTGVITARYTNGQSRILGQVALANFSNTQGLRQLGDTTWAESFESGPPLVGAPGSGSLGLIQSGALEGSNVDLTEQLVGMITAQRNFQANAQVITTADTITQSIINIR